VLGSETILHSFHTTACKGVSSLGKVVKSKRGIYNCEKKKQKNWKQFKEPTRENW
jgi:hypothetical protein